MVEIGEITELVTADDLPLQRLVGAHVYHDPAQIVRRMAREEGLPHIKLSARRYRFHLPTVREWVAAKAVRKTAAPGGAENNKAQENQVDSFQVAA